MNTSNFLTKRPAIIACAVSAVLVGMGCASKPPQALKDQLARTDSSIQQAEQAGAAQGGLPELQKAKDKRANAQDAMSDHKYDTALQLAQQAQLDAQYASRKSEADRADHSAAEVERGHDALQEETERKTGTETTTTRVETKTVTER